MVEKIIYPLVQTPPSSVGPSTGRSKHRLIRVLRKILLEPVRLPPESLNVLTKSQEREIVRLMREAVYLSRQNGMALRQIGEAFIDEEGNKYIAQALAVNNPKLLKIAGERLMRIDKE